MVWCRPRHLDELVRRVDGLPLALAQAGSYMQKTNVDVGGYLDLYEQKWTALFEGDHAFPLKDYPDRSILSTWTLSYDQVRQRHPEASYMLQLWACHDCKCLWYGLFTPTLKGTIIPPFRDL